MPFKDAEKRKAYCRKYYSNYRKRRPGYAAAVFKKCQKRLKAERFFEWKARLHRYRYKVYVSAKELAGLWKNQKGTCALTGFRLNRHNCQLDHIVPKTKGGGHGISNLQWTLAIANDAKRNLTDGEFLSLCKAVVAYHQGITITP